MLEEAFDNAPWAVILDVVKFEGRRRDDSWRSPVRGSLHAILSILGMLISRRKRRDLGRCQYLAATGIRRLMTVDINGPKQ